MFLNDLLQYSRKNMDENEAYNRELKGNKRGYLYNIMTNPNYGFTNATRQGAGQNLGFDVEMPQNPQEQQFQISEEMERRLGQKAIDPLTGKPTRTITGSVLGLYNKETPMTKANQGFDNFMGQQHTRQDHTKETGEHMGLIRQALGAGSGEPFKTDTWNPVTTGDPGTFYTGGHGPGSLKSYSATRAQRRLQNQGGGSSKIDPESKPITIDYTVDGKKRGSFELKWGIKPVVDRIIKNQEELSKIALVGKTFIDPISNQPKRFPTEQGLAEYLNNYRRTAYKIISQINNSKPGKPIEVDSAGFFMAQGLQEVIAQEGPPDTSEMQTVPQLSWNPAGGLLEWGKQDSTATMPGNKIITKLKNGGFLENGNPVEIGYLNQRYPEYNYLFNY